MHSPFPVQLFRQIFEQLGPSKPVLHLHIPLMQSLFAGQMTPAQVSKANEQSFPWKPLLHVQTPLEHAPLEEQLLGHVF